MLVLHVWKEPFVMIANYLMLLSDDVRFLTVDCLSSSLIHSHSFSYVFACLFGCTCTFLLDSRAEIPNNLRMALLHVTEPVSTITSSISASIFSSKYASIFSVSMLSFVISQLASSINSSIDSEEKCSSSNTISDVSSSIGAIVGS